MQVESKKMSFSYNVAGEGLKLIDISSEDDFLIAYPLFDSLEDLRLSVTWDNSKVSGIGTSANTNSAEKLFQMEQNMPSMQSGRPSYLRKSLAWDKAFFTNSGVLDSDELSFINNRACQLPGTQQDIRARRPECSSYSDDFSVNNFSASNGVGISSGNVIKSVGVSRRHPKNIHRSETKTKSLKPPMISPTKMKNASSGQSKTASMGTFHAKMQDSKTTRIGKGLLLPAKTAFGRSSCSSANFSSSTPTISSSVSSMSKIASSTLLKNRTGSRRSKLSASVSTSKTPLKCSLESKNLKNLIVPNQTEYKSPPANSTIGASISFSATSSLDGTPRRSGLRNSLQSPRFTSQETKKIMSTPTHQFSEQALLGNGASSGNSKPSCLRLPSPKIGFFDEVVPKARGLLKFQIGKSSKSAGPSNKYEPAKTPFGTGKLKQISTPQPRTASSFRLTNSPLFSGANKHENSAENDCKIWCKMRKVGAGEHERRSVKMNPDVKQQERRLKGALKTKLIKENIGQREEENVVKARKKMIGKSTKQQQRVNDLSRRFEQIDLWDDLKIDCKYGTKMQNEKSPEKPAELARSSLATEEKKSPGSVPITRTPLADKTRLCNGNNVVTLPFESVESKKERLEKAAIFPSSQGTHKENI